MFYLRAKSRRRVTIQALNGVKGGVVLYWKNWTLYPLGEGYLYHDPEYAISLNVSLDELNSLTWRYLFQQKFNYQIK